MNGGYADLCQWYLYEPGTERGTPPSRCPSRMSHERPQNDSTYRLSNSEPRKVSRSCERWFTTSSVTRTMSFARPGRHNVEAVEREKELVLGPDRILVAECKRCDHHVPLLALEPLHGVDGVADARWRNPRPGVKLLQPTHDKPLLRPGSWSFTT